MLVGWVNTCFSQQALIDSLKEVVRTTKNDTAKLQALDGLSSIYFSIDPDEAFGYARQVLDVSREMGFKAGMAGGYDGLARYYWVTGDFNKALDNLFAKLEIHKEEGNKAAVAKVGEKIGWMYHEQGNYAAALEQYRASLEIQKEIGNKLGVASSYSSMATVYGDQGDYPKALECHFDALEIYEAHGTRTDVASAHNNIGIIYMEQDKYAAALKQYAAALKVYEETGDKNFLAGTYSNIANVYGKQGLYKIALEQQTAALKIWEEIGDPMRLASSNNNLGLIHYYQGDYTAALERFFETLRIREKTGDQAGLASIHINIGNVYRSQGKVQKGKEELQKSLRLATAIGNRVFIRDSHKALAEADSALGSYASAYEHYKKYVLYRDSITNAESQAKSVQLQMQYEYGKEQAVAEAEYKAELQRQEEAAMLERNRQKGFLITVSCVGILVLVFAVLMLQRWQVTRKQKAVIEQQRDLVDEKNKEITDSIQYAKHIQSAMLPPAKLVKQYLQDSFILYKPKDIVAGDFYWMEVHDEKVFFTAADCTGHGVPGAMVSVMCSSALSQAVKELGILEPAKILDKTVDLLKERFAKSEHEVADGMDLALCCLDLKENKLHYAGANNPLLIINPSRTEWPENAWPFKNVSGGAEVKADKQPVGEFASRKPYTNHTINIHEGDTFYIFSDGFADQFGGEKGKKFKYKPFKRLLLDSYDRSMEEQKEILNRTIESWRGNLEQVDDICVIGLRMTGLT